MKRNVIKATVAISEFLTYIVTPEELVQTLKRSSTIEDTSRDREILSALAHKLNKVLKE